MSEFWKAKLSLHMQNQKHAKPPEELCCDFAKDLKKICFYGCANLLFIVGFSYINKIYMALKCNIWDKLLQSCMSLGTDLLGSD